MKTDFRERIFGNERKYLEEVLATEFCASKSSTMSKRLEQKVASVFGSTYAVSFVNGTATLHAVLEAIGVGPGDEVIVPPLTMAATSLAVLQANATPVFADVDWDTFEIHPKSIEERITTRTKAIITVALYGLSPDMDPIMATARTRAIFVLEDDAQCFLGKYKGRMVGTVGDAASFSFQGSKHVTSGEGGVIITDQLAVAEGARKVSSLGYAGVNAIQGQISKADIQHPEYSRHLTMGWNYRMSELCSAVALAQIENIVPLVERRREVARLFNEAVEGCEWLVPQKTGPDYVNSYWAWVARLDHPNLNWRQFRDRFVEAGGDGVYGAWKLTYLEPMFQNRMLLGREAFISPAHLASYARGLCPVAEALQPRLVQFKTNYWNIEDAERQARILRQVVSTE